MTTNIAELESAKTGGEDTRLELLLDRYAGLIRSVIRRHCPRDLGIQIVDVEQDARLRLWRALAREKEFVDPASYIHRIAVTATIDAVRRVRARREDQLWTAESAEDDQMPSGQETAIDEAQSPQADAERRELMETIARVVASLAENRRRAVELHLQGLSLADIATLLGWSEAKTRNLVYRGLDDLRDALRREGIEYP